MEKEWKVPLKRGEKATTFNIVMVTFGLFDPVPISEKSVVKMIILHKAIVTYLSKETGLV